MHWETIRGQLLSWKQAQERYLPWCPKPTFDPNTISEDWEWLTTDENSSLLNRATQGAYAPGSTFKLVTTLEYMREYSDFENYSYYCESEITHEGTTIHCAGNRAHGEENLADSLANSCNASYSNIGLMLDKEAYRKTAEELLFNKSFRLYCLTAKANFVWTKTQQTVKL